MGFIRSYAKYLDLDHDAVVEQFKSENFFTPANLPVVGDAQHFPTVRFVSNGMVVAGLFLLILCATAAYVFFDDIPVHINWPQLKPTL